MQHPFQRLQPVSNMCLSAGTLSFSELPIAYLKLPWIFPFAPCWASCWFSLRHMWPGFQWIFLLKRMLMIGICPLWIFPLFLQWHHFYFWYWTFRHPELPYATELVCNHVQRRFLQAILQSPECFLMWRRVQLFSCLDWWFLLGLLRPQGLDLLWIRQSCGTHRLLMCQRPWAHSMKIWLMHQMIQKPWRTGLNLMDVFQHWFRDLQTPWIPLPFRFVLKGEVRHKWPFHHSILF